MAQSKVSEKEKEAQLKALRRELTAEIEEALAPHLFPPPAFTGGGEEGGRVIDRSPKRILEALLFASAKPLTMKEIHKIVGAPFLAPEEAKGAMNRTLTAKQIQEGIHELQEEYRREGRSFELIEIAGGYEIVTRKEFAPWLAKLEQDQKARQASRSALETLAILAYKQPLPRAEIEELRGVDISAVLSTLLAKGFIKIVGRKEVPGRPFLYGTTEKFLEHFGLKSVADLPPIGEIKTLVERAVKKEEWIGSAAIAPKN